LATRSSTSHRCFCFGAFEFDNHSGELRKHALRIKLQGQPIEVLTMLLQHPGDVVTREELQKRLWAADTYVDFEHSLNAAMKRLRAALSDSAQAPRFIETLAGRGYRFIAPVSQPAEHIPQVAATKHKPARRRSLAFTAAAIAVIVLLAVAGLSLTGVRDSARSRAFSGPIRSLACSRWQIFRAIPIKTISSTE
jgi:DNA-binding winged helix-turn-helix (wHTH) protein